MASDTKTGGEGRSPWTRPGFLFAAGFCALLVVLLVVLLATTGGRSGGGPGGHPGPARPPAGATGAVPPVDPGPTTVPVAPPQNVTWQLYQTVALPYSTQAGPYEVTASTATGYAHTPTGALIAAVQIPVRMLAAPDWRAVVDRQVADGPGKAAYTTARATVTDTTVTPGELGQTAGFRFVNYTPAVATIQVVTRFVSGALQVTTMTVQWADSGWLLVLQPDGSQSPTAQSIPNLLGYVAWGGV